MSKRFTDTNKWEDPWFCDLDINGKLLWEYLCDKCDHAGIWKVNMRLAEFHLGFKPDVNGLGGRAIELRSGKWFLPGFVDFQYGELNPANKVHASVIFILKKEGAWKDLKSPLQGAKDKDKDKEKDKDKDKDKGVVGGRERPTLSQVAAYCKERNNNVDPERWLAHYESNGWRVGRNPMKDWKAAIRTWEKNSGGFGNQNGIKKNNGEARPRPGKYAHLG